ncbi:MAG: porin family protein [Gammaproteobacteria bacterium]|nr:porin family protein [Gammaproteobacteria bacterium]
MKRACMVLTAAALLVPAVTFAAAPSQTAPSPKTASQAAGLSKWTIPYVGFFTGFHRSSLDDFSTETGSMTGVRAGWNVLVGISGVHFVLGGSIFYSWNADQTHQSCTAAGCSSINVGSTVFGFDARIGYPFGGDGQFMAYIHGGPSHIGFTGGSTTLSDNSTSRYGLGFVWAPDNSPFRIDLQYTHVGYGAGVGNWTNDNLTLGIHIGF